MVSETLDADPKTELLAFYTDTAKIFDKVPHSELLHKSEKMGVRGCFLQVLVDYLTNRKHCVRIGNCSSTKLTTNNHVIFELELKHFQRWYKENQMLLAEGKNCFLEFRGSNSNFELNAEILKPAEYMKDLGLFICPDLTWNKNIDEKLKKAVQTLHF